MSFNFTSTAIPEVILIEPQIYPDERGFFLEIYKNSDFAARGMAVNYAQCNQSKSRKGTIRGLHYQKAPKVQCKLVWVVSGEIYDVAADLRRSSRTYGKWTGITISAENKKILYVPGGFAHGFCVTSEQAEVVYLTTEEYAPKYEAGIVWNDPNLAIAWPIAKPLVSVRDRNWPFLCDADHDFM